MNSGDDLRMMALDAIRKLDPRYLSDCVGVTTCPFCQVEFHTTAGILNEGHLPECIWVLSGALAIFAEREAVFFESLIKPDKTDKYNEMCRDRVKEYRELYRSRL